MNPRFAVLAVNVAGAICSLALMLRAGSRQQSIVLIALFTGWVLSPFVVLGWAAIVSKAWPAPARTTVHTMTVFVTLLSVAMYGGVIPMPPGSRPAAVFLLVPLLSWILFAVLAGVFRLRSR